MNQPASFDQIAAADIAYIQRHWTLLAAKAWRSYVRHGRGIIVIDWANGRGPNISYHTQATARTVRCSSWLSAETAVQIKRYDPRREVICIVIHDHTTITTYRLSVATLAPPDAYAQLCQHPYAPMA
jgi:hypothetical protein